MSNGTHIPCFFPIFILCKFMQLNFTFSKQKRQIPQKHFLRDVTLIAFYFVN